MLYKNRGRFDSLSRETGKVFGNLPVSANAWTILSFAFAVAAAYLIYIEDFPFALLFFSVSALLDFVDGAVARFQGKACPKGAYLDTITDRYVEFLILFALFFVSYPRFVFSPRVWIVLIMFGSFMTTYAKAAGFEKGREIKGGLMERPERMILIFATLFVSWIYRAGAIYFLAAMGVLVNISALQRIWIALKAKN